MKIHTILIVIYLVFAPSLSASRDGREALSFSVTKRESGKSGYPEISSGHISVYGAANRPGIFKHHPNLTIAQALEMAGGPTRLASPDTFSIVSRDQTVVRMWGVSIKSERGSTLYSRIILNEGDTLLIHENGGF